jgi:cyclase
MLTKRIIPCLDIKNGQVVKGIQFKNHRIVGDIISLATYYCDSGADELVFYDISASADQRTVTTDWVKKVAQCLNIPFCVAGGISSLSDAEAVLNAGADKISINSPALLNPNLINQMVDVFGQQCVVIGIDSLFVNDNYTVCQFTGDEKKMRYTEHLTANWIDEVQSRGAGEVVLNCMNQDGMRQGYDIAQLQIMRKITRVPLVASGGAGCPEDFVAVFQQANVDAALAASVFHNNSVSIIELKNFLSEHHIEVRHVE